MRGRAGMRRGACAGQALAELVAVGALFVLLMILVPLLGAWLDAEHKTVEAARTAAWERTVWAEKASDRGVGASPAVRSDEEIRRLVEVAVLGHPSAPLTSAPTESPVWLDHAGRDMLAGAPGARATQSLDERRLEAGGTAGAMADRIARGDGVLGARSLGLGRRGLAEGGVETGLRAHPELPDFKGARLAVTAAVLSDAWSAAREPAFRARVGRATLASTIEPLVQPARVIGAFPLFKEGKDALPLEPAVAAGALPEEYRVTE